MMRIGLICLCLFALAACERQGDRFGRNAQSGRSVELSLAESAVPAPAMARGGAPARSATLAYEHQVGIELGSEQVTARVRELQTACAADKQFNCTLLDISTGRNDDLPNGTVRLRLAPAGTEPFIALAAKGGEIVDRSTHAEDLAEPVADVERQLAQLRTHRQRLDEFLKNRDIKIDQLITVSKELASVQAQLDEFGNQRANLQRRIDTELLTLRLMPPEQAYRSARHPVRDALRSFTNDFMSAIGQVIRFFAGLVPWLVVLVPSLIVLRLFWRWIGRWIARRERPQ